MELLLGQGASIETQNRYNQTPLHHAAFYGYTTTGELLLREGAWIEAKDWHGETPLHHAARSF